MNDLKSVISDNERIIWEGKPNKTCFILESIFNPLLPFAFVWFLIDFGIIGVSITSIHEFGLILLPFFLLHLMPVWIYIGGILLSIRKYNNTYYIITDQAVYVSGGSFSYSYEMKPFTQLTNITLHRGIFDQKLNVGDVIFNMGYTSNSDGGAVPINLSIINIKEYQEVYKLVKDLQRDIYSDTMYPNDLRPDENHGYKTKYKEK